ncbi:hypothetical protein Tco_0118924, partial [Tanacetum coccineum]
LIRCINPTRIPFVLSAPLFDVLVSIILLQATITTTPLATPLTTPLPTPSIISTSTTTTPTVPDLLSEVVQRVYALEKEVKELKQVDHSTTVLASVRSQVPLLVDEYLGLTLGDTLQKVLQKHTKELIQQFPEASVSKIMKVKQEQAAKKKVPKFSSTPYDQQANEEHKHKDILFKMMMSSKSYERHPAHKALYDALLEYIFVDENDLDRLAVDPATHRKRRHEDKDEDHSAGSDQGKKKRKQGDKSKSLKKSYTSKESSKR